MPFGKVYTIILEAGADGVFHETTLISGELPPPKSDKQGGCDGFWSWLHDFFKTESVNDNGRIFNPESCESNYDSSSIGGDGFGEATASHNQDVDNTPVSGWWS